MEPWEALEAAKGCAGANRIRFSSHALERMEERQATYRDVREALMTATACDSQPNGRWKVSGGHDLDGDALYLVVVLEGDVLVVTLF